MYTILLTNLMVIPKLCDRAGREPEIRFYHLFFCKKQIIYNGELISLLSLFSLEEEAA
jgi:hypothetical protein